MFDCTLGLMTGIDIPIPEIQMVMHQPTIKEISLIGEEGFFTGLQFLSIKASAWGELSEEIGQLSNFQLFIQLLFDQRMAEKKEVVLEVLRLLFPKNNPQLTPGSILLNQEGTTFIIDESNFQALQDMLDRVFSLEGTDKVSYNPSNAKAAEIAKKLQRGREKVAAQKAKENGGSGSMLSQYLSVLTVGLGSMSLNDLMNLTLYQLQDLIKRYSLYLSWDIDLRARVFGGGSDSPVEDWMKSIH